MSQRLGNSIRLRLQTGLQNFNDDEDVNRTWENIKENIQTSAKESLVLDEFKQNKLWFEEEFLGFFGSKEAG